MSNVKGERPGQWTPMKWCRACGGSYKRYIGGLKSCCAKCSEDIVKLEEALRKEEASARPKSRRVGEV